MEIRMKAYKMDIDPDSAEKLANEVGIEQVSKILDTVQKKLDYQDSMPFHPKKKSAGWHFGHLAQICRMTHRAGKKNQMMSEEMAKSVAKVKKEYEDGFRPTPNALGNMLEKMAENEEESAKVDYEDFQRAMRFLDLLEE